MKKKTERKSCSTKSAYKRLSKKIYLIVFLKIIKLGKLNSEV